MFADVAVSAGVAADQYDNEALPYGAGVIIFDFDGDGFQDIFVPDRLGPDALYRNSGNGAFNDVVAAAGVDDRGVTGSGGGCAADYDNDGDQDIYVSSYGPSRLFRNEGDSTFSDVTAAAGIEEPDATYTTGCAWGDYDRDGGVDLIVVRHMHGWSPGMRERADFAREVRPLALYRNQGNGTFADVTHLLGDPTTRAATGGSGERFGRVWGAGFQPGWLDYDNDGDPDLYVVNDFGPLVQPNVLWRNDGLGLDGRWRFVDISTSSGAGVPMHGMGLAVGDYDLDGFLDLFMTNIDSLAKSLCRSN